MEEPSATPVAGAAASGAAVGRTAGALGPAPTAAAEGPAAEGPTVEDGSTVATSAAVYPATVEEESTTGEDGPWRTRGL